MLLKRLKRAGFILSIFFLNQIQAQNNKVTSGDNVTRLEGVSVYGQQIHHQMISSQGSSKLITTGFRFNQTIGQQSVVGNYKVSNLYIGQGFQQSTISRSKTSLSSNKIITTTYPNPFIDQINFQFSSPVNGLISISIFDLLGRLVYKEEKEASQNILSLDNIHFAKNGYLVKLAAKNYNHSTQIIQTK
jgi:hypothetical protein